jgi:hypothetical protein
MELPGSGYLYTLAVLAMTFVGFCAIVLAFRHTSKTSPANVLHSHIYIELGFSAAGFAMLPPLFATFGLSAPHHLALLSLIIAVILVIQTCLFVVRVLRVTESSICAATILLASGSRGRYGPTRAKSRRANILRTFPGFRFSVRDARAWFLLAMSPRNNRPYSFMKVVQANFGH